MDILLCATEYYGSSIDSYGYLLNLQIYYPVIKDKLLYLNHKKSNYLTLLATEFMAEILGVLRVESFEKESDLNYIDLVSFCNLKD